MDIKKRIQELSLDQKAKLYFMGLVRQGKIDTLPEDPKAAYVDMLYKDLANVGKDTDDYGRSVSGKDKRTFMEPEDSMPAARARKLSGMEDDEMETRYDYDDPVFEDLKEAASKLGYLNEKQPTSISDEDLDDLRDIILKYVKDPDDAEAEVDRFDQGGFDAMSNMVTANLLRDPEYQAWAKKFNSIKESNDVRKVIRKIIKEQNFDDRLRSMMGADDFEKATNPKLAKLINNAIMSIDPNMSYVDFAKGVAQVLIDEYGVQNYEPFISELKKELDSTLG